MYSRFCRLCVSLLALFAPGQSARASDKPAAAPEVPVARPVVREVTDHADFTGRAEAAQRVELRARVTGFLTAARFKEGDRVNHGAVLFEIDPRPYQAQLDQAIAQVNLHKAGLKLAHLTLARDQELTKRVPGSVSQQQLDQDAAAVEEAVARVKAAEASAEVSRLSLDFCRVTAPISGRIGRRQVDPGNLVMQDQTALATIVSEQPMYVYFDMDERTYLELRQSLPTGKPATENVPVAVGLANDKGFPHRGELSFVNNQFDADTGAIRMRAVLANKDRRLLPGMFVRVRVTLGAPYKALLVPDRAVMSDLDSKYLYVVDAQNKLAVRQVTVGSLQPDDLRVIRKGLEPDDRVVTGGLARLRPGISVRPQEGTAPAPKPAPPSDPVPLKQAPGRGIRVETSYAGANAETVSEAVRWPIEKQVSGLEKVRYLRSRCTSDGKYALDVAFAAAVDPWLAQMRVQNRVALALPVLPAAVQEAGVHVRRGSAGVLAVVTLSAPDGDQDPIFLGNYANLYLKDELTRLAGVADATLVGSSDYGLRVWLDPARLAARGLNAADVTRVLREKKAVGAARSDDLGDLIVQTTADGRTVRLRDVARVETGTAGSPSAAFEDGRPAVAIFIHLTGDVAAPKVRAALRQRLRDLRAELPRGVVQEIACDFAANLQAPGKSAGADYALVDLDLAAATPERIGDVLKEGTALMRQLPVVKHVLAVSENQFDAFGGRPCLLVCLNPPAQDRADRGEAIAAIRTRLSTLKVVTVRVRDLSAPGSFPRCGYPIDLALYGPDAAEVREWARKVGERLRDSKKLTDVWVNPDSVPRPTRFVDIDRTRAAALGVPVSDILSTIEVYAGAVTVGHANRFGRSLRVEVQAPGPPGDWAQGLGSLMVRNAKGQMVPLGSFARVRQVEQSVALDFLDLRPMVEITANAAPGTSVEAARTFCTALAEEVRRDLGLPAQYRRTWLHANP